MLPLGLMPNPQTCSNWLQHKTFPSLSESCQIPLAETAGRSLNVAFLYGAYEDSKNVMLVMEMCTGGEMWNRVRRGRYSEKGASCHVSAHGEPHASWSLEWLFRLTFSPQIVCSDSQLLTTLIYKQMKFCFLVSWMFCLL